MKKKYLALILSCIMCSSLFFTGCGKTAEEPVIEEDDDDEDEDGDDDDDKEDDDDDDKDDKNVYVESIDEETLAEQIKVFVKNKKLWTVSGEMTIELDNAAYCVTDLDHNGRSEIVVMTESAYSTVTDMRIFEITEKGDAFKEAEFDYSGIQNVTSSLAPDLINFPESVTYFNRVGQASHYRTDNTFVNGNGEYGDCFCDICYEEGVAAVYTYLSVKVNQIPVPGTMEFDNEYTFYSPDGEIDEDEYYDILTTYPGEYGTKDQYFGIYYRGVYDDLGVMGLEDSFLVSVLTDSYRVFTGEKDYSDFYGLYNDSWAPDQSYGVDNSNYIGYWGLYESEVEGDVTSYEYASDFYRTLEIDYDSFVTMIEYYDGKPSYVWSTVLYTDDDQNPYFEITDSTILPDDIVCERYTITGINSDKDIIYVSLDLYGYDGYLGGSTLTFLKDYT